MLNAASTQPHRAPGRSAGAHAYTSNRPAPRAVLRLFSPGALTIRLFVSIAVTLTVIYLAGWYGWYTTAQMGDPEFGINFSCKRAEHFGQDCPGLFANVLDELGARHVRISAYWSDIEGQPGVYDFRAVDELLSIAESRGARVTVTIGMKAQRFPEFWFPTWLRLAAN